MHMQSEALMGQPMFCIQHTLYPCHFVNKVNYMDIARKSTRSNGIENEHAQWQSWNSPSFFTVKNFNNRSLVVALRSVRFSELLFHLHGSLPRYENICCMPFRHLQMKFMNTSELFEQLRRVVYLSLYYRHTQSCLQSSLNPASYAIGALVYKVMNCNRYNEMNYANFY
ncbi:hypothetical protein T4B_5031 [Trichinella pseudospiralis]|uniref:Uncharacterized protein n=1 Tax=Trichinella pseudospiralis TaxID=6337 RepID=A0A0V1H3U7_TRIPS|nr:hypothetical protein T4B_8303 [Trichinella pseudospiralis]KRZ05214.1 hypothetical protein T4B_5258 [Trichinella pseudospiralis]KRZ05262.1 hypothetical protein T4B_5031 [Trichinella pseudospiralis]